MTSVHACNFMRHCRQIDMHVYFNGFRTALTAIAQLDVRVDKILLTDMFLFHIVVHLSVCQCVTTQTDIVVYILCVSALWDRQTDRLEQVISRQTIHSEVSLCSLICISPKEIAMFKSNCSKWALGLLERIPHLKD